MTTILLFILSVIVLPGLIYFVYTTLDKRISNVKSNIDKSIIDNTTKTKKLVAKTNEDLENVKVKLTDTKSLIDHIIQWQAKVDIAMIRMIDVPYLYDQLSPGFPNKWSGEIPYAIPDIFVGSSIKIDDYEYIIDKIDNKMIEISK